jgi:hypothetical protein
VRVGVAETTFDAEAALEARFYATEKNCDLRAVFQVSPERGRLFSLLLRTPGEWRVAALKELETGRGLEWRPLGDETSLDSLLLLRHASDAEHPLRFEVVCVPREAPDGEDAWERRQTRFGLPEVVGARRSAKRLTIKVDAELEAVFGDMPGWRAESAARLAASGMSVAELRAGFVRETAGGGVDVRLTRKKARGEYDLTTHVLAREKEAWVRTDVKLTAVDRALTELFVALPDEAADPLHAAPVGFIKEIVPQKGGRLFRFQRPWLGVKVLRIEYRVPLVEGAQTPIPNIRLTGGFDGRRRVVFQSTENVEVEVKPGPGLRPAVFEETPEFAQPFQEGRPLHAFVYRPEGDAGTYRAGVFARLETARRSVGKLRLHTALDAAGLSRVRALFVLTRDREQYQPALVPPDASLISVLVDGRNVLPIRQPNEPVGRFNIPLPSKSAVTVELAYERRGRPLSSFGSLFADGLVLPDTPAAQTEWTIHCPPGYALNLIGGDVHAETAEPPAFFALTFWGRLFSGRKPLWTAWRRISPAFVKPTDDAMPTVKPVLPAGQPTHKALRALETAEEQSVGLPPLALANLTNVAGPALRLKKIGGSPVAELAYRKTAWAQGAARTTFILAFLAALSLRLRRSRRTAWLLLPWALFLATLLPPAINYASPTLLVPFAEGLTLALIALGLEEIIRGLFRLCAWYAKGRRRAGGVPVACLLLGASLAADGAVSAFAAENDPAPVLIPYAPEEVTNPDADPNARKVLVPKARFLELRASAYPEEVRAPEDFPRRLETPGEAGIVSWAWGAAEYELTLDKNAFRLHGRLPVRTFRAADWVKVPLAFGEARARAIRFNGKPASVAYDENNAPFLAIHGAGEHWVEIEAVGATHLSPGAGEARLHLAGGGAVRLRVVLPSDLELNGAALPNGAWLRREPTDQGRCWVLGLGGGGAVVLRWHSPKIAGDLPARPTVTAFTSLVADSDGCLVSRWEDVAVESGAFERLFYRVLGAWEIFSVSAPELTDWAVEGAGAERRLALRFRKPTTSATIVFSGRALLTDAPTAAPGLALENALRQTGWLGLRHGAQRRFTADSLKNLRRVPEAEPRRAFALVAESGFDRVLRYHEIPEGESIQTEPVKIRADVETTATVVFRAESALCCVRSRYKTGGGGPSRQEVVLPTDWDVRMVRGTEVHSWEIKEAEDQRRLVIRFLSPARSGSEVVWSVESAVPLPLNGMPRRVKLPAVCAVADDERRETVVWSFAADRTWDISQADEAQWRATPLTAAMRWVALEDGESFRFAARAVKADARPEISIARATATADCRVISFIRTAEEHVQMNVRCEFDVTGAGLDRLALRLPPGARLTMLNANNMRSREETPTAEGTEVVVRLQSAVTGRGWVDLICRLPRKGESDERIEAPRLSGSEIKSVAHFVGLLRIGEDAAAIQRVEKLTPVESGGAVPYLPDNISPDSVQQLWRGGNDWALVLRRPETEIVSDADLRIMVADLKTVIAADGRMSAAAEYLVRNRAPRFLKIIMPANVKLWNVLVGGRPATAAKTQTQGRETLLIPLARMSSTDLPVKITVTYEHPPTALPAVWRSIAPTAPEIPDADVLETHWRLYVPSSYRVLRTGGNVRDALPNVLVGGRLRTNTDELERLFKLHDGAASEKMRRQAAFNIARLQQELSDHLEEMQDNDRNEVAVLSRQRLKREELDQQKGQNQEDAVRARSFQRKIQGYSQALEQAQSSSWKENAEKDSQQTLNFMFNAWREQKKSEDRSPSRVVEAGQTDVNVLRNAGKSPVALGAEPRSSPAQIMESDVNALGDETPLRKNLQTTWAGDQPLVDLMPQERDLGEVYFYHRLGGKPELVVALRSEPYTWRLIAWAALFMVPAFVWLIRRRILRTAEI